MSNSKSRKSASSSGSKEAAVPAMPVVKGDVKKTPAATQFQVQTKPGSNVFVAGDFNNWDCEKNELLDKDGNGVYQGELILEPGTYEYKFRINGAWCVDPANPNFRQNHMGTLNSVIIVE